MIKVKVNGLKTKTIWDLENFQYYIYKLCPSNIKYVIKMFKLWERKGNNSFKSKNIQNLFV